MSTKFERRINATNLVSDFTHHGINAIYLMKSNIAMLVSGKKIIKKLGLSWGIQESM